MPDTNDKTTGLIGAGAFLAERFKIAIATIIIWLVFALVSNLFTPWINQAVAVWTTPERLERMDERLESIAYQINGITGESRVVRLDRLNSYVFEPVHIGETIRLNLVVSRTDRGRDCVLISRTALFTDEGGISIPGVRAVPSRQVGVTPERMLLRLEPPGQLRPGRVTVALSLEFQCAGQPVFEITEPVAFRLLPERRQER